MWVWQSQAPGGTSKFTGVDGCAAVAKTGLSGIVIPAAMEANEIYRVLRTSFHSTRLEHRTTPRAPTKQMSQGWADRSSRAVVRVQELIRPAYRPDGVRRPCQASRT